jgi:uncharacterized protein HemX
MKKLASFVLLLVVGFGASVPVYARRVNSQKAQARAAQKQQKKQQKAMKKYMKAQQKAQRKMSARDRKNTHYPKHQF